MTVIGGQTFIEKELFVWGTGDIGGVVADMLDNAGLTIAAFIDSNIQRHGQSFRKHPIISPAEALRRDPTNFYIVIATSIDWTAEVAAMCEKSGLEPEKNFIAYESGLGRILEIAGKTSVALRRIAGRRIGFGECISFCRSIDAEYVNLLQRNHLISRVQEDIIIYEYLYHVSNGFYIDVGCAEHELGSVTRLFYDQGWSGINVDPRSNAIIPYATHRPRDVNCCMGVSNKEGELPFWVRAGLSTFDRENMERLRKEGCAFTETTVPVTTLNALLETHHPIGEIHFLKIDAEQHERQVLEGIDLKRHRPWLVVVEATLPCSDIPSHIEWEKILLDNRYRLLLCHDVDRYYAAAERYDELIAARGAKFPTPFMKL